MSHDPYREWIFADVTPTSEQQRQLEQHFERCHACRSLQHGWQAARAALDASAAVGAPEGFAHRFQLRLAARKAAASRRQAALTLALTALGALGSAFLLLELVTIGLVDGLAHSLRGMLALRQAIAVTSAALGDALAALPGPSEAVILPALSVAVLGALVALFAGLGGLWVAAVYRFADPKLISGGRTS